MALITPLACLACPGAYAAQRVGWIGTYTSRGHSTSAGIYSFHWNTRSGAISDLRAVAPSSNPSFLALHPNGRYLYATSEGGTGELADHIVAYAVNATDRAADLKELGAVAAGGKGPCHLSIDSTGHWLFAANYVSGTLAVFAIRSDGRLADAAQIIPQQASTGTPDNRGSHAHQILQSPDGRFILAANLGLDRIFVYHFDASNGSLSANNPPSFELASGDGPRHLLFAPDGQHVYLVNELSASLVSLRWDASSGQLQPLSQVSILPPGYAGLRSGSELALLPESSNLYVSSRGDSNSVTIFHLGRDGTAQRIGSIASGGRTPRFIGIDPSGRFLLAANQDSDNLTIFRITPRTGLLAPHGAAVPVPAPTDVVFDRLAPARPDP
jgi:6-phosphogluconolactonase